MRVPWTIYQAKGTCKKKGSDQKLVLHTSKNIHMPRLDDCRLRKKKIEGNYSNKTYTHKMEAWDVGFGLLLFPSLFK
jgi:hypothetical protein